MWEPKYCIYYLKIYFFHFLEYIIFKKNETINFLLFMNFKNNIYDYFYFIKFIIFNFENDEY